MKEVIEKLKTEINGLKAERKQIEDKIAANEAALLSLVRAYKIEGILAEEEDPWRKVLQDKYNLKEKILMLLKNEPNGLTIKRISDLLEAKEGSVNVEMGMLKLWGNVKRLPKELGEKNFRFKWVFDMP